ncbi:MAG: 30S ribosomal protein S8e [Candidatus Diapherotrites archaeon]|nr:30S ribosomal protein S8e [Candidatus Diapherotrites archaeon]
MTQWHLKSKKKPSGGKHNTVNRADKKRYQRGGLAAHTTIAAKAETEQVTTKGGKQNLVALKATHALVTDPKTHKTVKAQLLSVVENPADNQFARRNIITKGAILRVKLGEHEKYVKVTSRPGQDAHVNTMLLEHYKTAKETKAESAAGTKTAKTKASKAPPKRITPHSPSFSALNRGHLI